MAMDLSKFNWINESELKVEDDSFYLLSTPNSDFFCNPADDSVVSDAPFLYKEVSGDFLISARVKPTFQSTFDACTVFVYADDRHWLKIAFEYTDMESHSIVTVATDHYSDDAIGEEMKEEAVYLQIVRKGDIFACHYSADGVNYRLARILGLKMPAAVKVGVSAQAPTGQGQFMEFRDLKLTQALPKDMRTSI